MQLMLQINSSLLFFENILAKKLIFTTKREMF
jgi:hypothetical protein